MTTKTTKRATSAEVDRAHMLTLRATKAHLTRATMALQATKDRAERTALRARIADLSARVAAL